MFVYDPLPRDTLEIRLVRFLDPSGPDTRLSLELRHASMSNTNYAALSYVWGDVKDTIEIKVNGSSLNIGRNLHTGLEQLRKDGVSGWLWIDSICIQQSDLDEKSYQVGLMRAIFSNADRIYSWLGPSTSGSDAAMDFISRIGPRAIKCRAKDMLANDKRVTAYLNNPSLYEASASDDDEILEYARFIHDLLNEPDLRGKTYGDEGLAAGIQNLMQRDYWHRIWINQEIALAKEVVIVCGTKTVSLDLLEAALDPVDDCYARYRFHSPETRDFARGLHSNFFYILALETRRQHIRGNAIPLDSMLFIRVSPPDRPFYSATDPRDIVFGLLGITTDNERLGIRVDYRASMAAVFTATTRAFVESGHTYYGSYTLDSCVPKEIADGLPSWVPDWREIGTEGIVEDQINHSRLFDTTPGIPVPPIARFNDDDTLGILRRHGCRVDIITEVMQPHKEAYDPDHAAMDLANLESRLQSILDFTNLGTETGPGEDYIWRSLLAHNWYRRINASMSEDIAVLIRKIMRRSPINADILTSRQKTFIRDLRDFWNKPSDDDTFSDQLANARKRLQGHERYFNNQRALFKTAKSMLGLGYNMVRPGDVVTLLWGVQAPIILRPREGGGLTFAGDAYVDGIMHGEFIDTKPAHEEFEIY